MFQGFRSSSANLDVVQQVEAKYPALLFKQQLSAYVEKIYALLRDNLKKDLSSYLNALIEVLFLIFMVFLYGLWTLSLYFCLDKLGLSEITGIEEGCWSWYEQFQSTL